ncbi:MAG: hypothetical protein WCK10_01200 [Candidatus Staskawiczbacteria bacterium]
MSFSDKIKNAFSVAGPIFLLLLLLLSLIGAEYLIYYNHEARENWTRMLPCAIISPFLFIIAIIGTISGMAGLVQIPGSVYKLITGDYSIDQAGPLALTGGGLFGCGGTVYRWIKYIVIDNYPAFGYNPDNVYAVTGLNTMFLMPIMIIVGALAGLIIYWALCLIIRTIRSIFC